jgi:hypothetical protein
MWIEPFVVPGGQLKKLFIANVPVNWDVLWILLLLGAAPALESFHVHVRFFLTKLTENMCAWMLEILTVNPTVLKSDRLTTTRSSEAQVIFVTVWTPMRSNIRTVA